MVCTRELLCCFCESLRSLEKGKRNADAGKCVVVHPVERDARQELRYRWNSSYQRRPQLPLPGLTCDVLPPCPWEPTTRLQMGIYLRVLGLCSHYHLHDGAGGHLWGCTINADGVFRSSPPSSSRSRVCRTSRLRCQTVSYSWRTCLTMLSSGISSFPFLRLLDYTSLPVSYS